MAEELEEKASEKVAKKIKEWRPEEMSRPQQEKFVRSLFEIAIEQHQKTEIIVKGDSTRSDRTYQWTKEPWRPEYDEMSLLFLTPEETEKYQKEGLNRQQIIKKAKEQILTAMWRECQDSCSSVRVEKDNIYAIEECQHSKRFYEEYLFNDDAVINTLYAISHKNVLRPLIKREMKPFTEESLRDEHDYDVNKNIYREKKFYKGIRDDGLFSTLKNVFQRRSPEKIAEEKAKKVRIYHIRKELDMSDSVGKTCLDVLDKKGFGIELDTLESVAGSVDLKRKKILLNSSMLKEAQVLSLINATCCILKNGKDGKATSKEDVDAKLKWYEPVTADDIRRSDPLTTQRCFAEEMERKYWRPIYNAIVEWKSKAGNTIATSVDKNVYTEKMIKDALAVKAKQSGR